MKESESFDKDPNASFLCRGKLFSEELYPKLFLNTQKVPEIVANNRYSNVKQLFTRLSFDSRERAEHLQSTYREVGSYHAEKPSPYLLLYSVEGTAAEVDLQLRPINGTAYYSLMGRMIGTDKPAQKAVLWSSDGSKGWEMGCDPKAGFRFQGLRSGEYYLTIYNDEAIIELGPVSF
ncbi:MAG TPA: hypothetical protein VH186_11345 [Chloroflexia bacterium]|nr:hypothetical protein [Chloroflexia bacterium]